MEAWNNKGSNNWWVSPTFSQSKNALVLVKKLLPVGMYKEYKADMRIEILEPDGSVRSDISFKSGDNPDSLRGFGVDFCVMDEAARMPYESYISVWTTLTQTMGRAMIISTPKGRGWFFELFQRGAALREQYPEYYSVAIPTWASPHVKTAAITQLRSALPEDVFRQEIAAEFLSDSAGVFRGINNCVKGVLEEPQRGRQYVMGVDLARLRDFSVISVFDKQRNHLVYFDRFNQIDWTVQYHKIIEAAEKYNNAITWIDSTGIGDPIVETIRSAGVIVEPYKIGGSAAKQQLIEKLRVNIENGRISFPNVPVVIHELENYEYEISESGVVRYNASTGFHDDAVISVALANWGADAAPWVYRQYNCRGI